MSKIICTSVVLNGEVLKPGNNDKKNGFLVVDKVDGFHLICKTTIVSVTQDSATTAAFDVKVLKKGKVLIEVDTGKTLHLQMTRSYGDSK